MAQHPAAPRQDSVLHQTGKVAVHWPPCRHLPPQGIAVSHHSLIDALQECDAFGCKDLAGGCQGRGVDGLGGGARGAGIENEQHCGEEIQNCVVREGSGRCKTRLGGRAARPLPLTPMSAHQPAMPSKKGACRKPAGHLA